MNNELPAYRKTIGFLRRGYSPTGGAEAYLKRLGEGLHQQGYRVVLLGTEAWPHEEWPGGEVIALSAKSLRDFGLAALRLKQERQIDLLFSLERVPGCDFFRAGDGVHAAWLRRQAVVEPWWSSFLKQWMPKHREILQLERELFSSESKTKIIANSKMVAQEIMEKFSVSADRITIIPNGVPIPSEITHEQRALLRKQFGMEENELAVLFVGSGWKRKGLETALQAVERFGGKMRLWVAGKGNTKGYRSSAVKFLGAIKDLSQLYAAADLFILPTLYDPFSNASLEALAAGLPVITSSANGCAEILEPEIHGSVIADPQDVASFAAALEKWQERLQDHDDVAEVRRACAARGAALSIERNVQATLNIIEEELHRLS